MPGPQRLPCETPRAFQPVAGARPSRWILPATILGSSMSFIDGSVVNVALPSIQSGLQASLATAQWVINGYLLALAALILLGGALGDRFGERRIFMAGLGGLVFGFSRVWLGADSRRAHRGAPCSGVGSRFARAIEPRHTGIELCR